MVGITEIRFVADGEVADVCPVIVPNIFIDHGIIRFEVGQRVLCVQHAHCVDHLRAGGLGEVEQAVYAPIAVRIIADGHHGIHRASAHAKAMDAEVLEQGS